MAGEALEGRDEMFQLPGGNGKKNGDGEAKARYFGITVTEVFEEERQSFPKLRKHEESVIFQQLIAEHNFDLREVMRAILKGFEKEVFSK